MALALHARNADKAARARLAEVEVARAYTAAGAVCITLSSDLGEPGRAMSMGSGKVVTDLVTGRESKLDPSG